MGAVIEIRDAFGEVLVQYEAPAAGMFRAIED